MEEMEDVARVVVDYFDNFFFVQVHAIKWRNA